MAENRVVVSEDNEETYEITGVGLGTVKSQSAAPEDTDIFATNAKEVLKFAGLQPTFKRSSSRTLSKMRTGDGAESKQINIEEVTGYQLFDVVIPPFNLDYLAGIYEISPAQYAAVNAKVNNVVGLGFDLVQSFKTKKQLQKREGDPLKNLQNRLAQAKQDILDAIDGWNDEDTFIEVLQKAWTDFEATGNGYIEIGRKNTGEIGYVGHIPSITMRVRKQRDGYVQIFSNKAVFFRNFGDQTTTNPIGNDRRPNEVIHIKNYSPMNSYYGVPDIIAAKLALAGNEFAGRYNLDYFENKAVPRYIITVKGATLSLPAQRQLLDFFQNSVKGKNHRTLYVPLPADREGQKVEFKMEPVETGIQDASFSNYRKANLSDILMVNGVPLSKVSNSESSSLAAARDSDKTFKESVCRPRQDLLEKKLGKLFKEVTDLFDFKLNELTLTDEDTQSQIDERNIRNQLNTPNEIRARRGEPGLPSGDKIVETKTGAGTPQQAAEAKAQATGTRVRDQQRTANATDSKGEGRNAQGDGRVQG